MRLTLVCYINSSYTGGKLVARDATRFLRMRRPNGWVYGAGDKLRMTVGGLASL